MSDNILAMAFKLGMTVDLADSRHSVYTLARFNDLDIDTVQVHSGSADEKKITVEISGRLSK